MRNRTNQKPVTRHALPDPEILRTLKSFGLTRRHFLRNLGL